MLTTNALLLQRTPYLGKKSILRCLTKETGLVTFFAHDCKFTPFCLVECTYRDTNKEMWPLKEIYLIDALSHLKQNYERLKAAGQIARDLLHTGAPNKPANELFDLAYFYFKKMESAPKVFASSFRLKLLMHEGLFSNEPHPLFTPLEWSKVLTLTFSRKLSEIESTVEIPHEKIDHFFEERLHS